MSMRSAIRPLVCVAIAASFALPAAAQDQDNGAFTGGAPEAMSQIPAMTVPAATLDFDLMPAGPTTVAAVQAQFPTAGIVDMVFDPCTGSTPGSYNTNPAGRALAADPSGSLGLYLVDPPTGAFGCTDRLTITLSGLVTQFGAQVADWNGGFDFVVYDGAAQVGLITVDMTGAPLIYVESTVPFDTVVLTTIPASPQGNYVFPTLVFPEQTQADADLEITKTAETTSPTSGRYVLRVENLGPDDATGVTVTDTLPAGVTYVSDTCGGMMGTPWTWNVGALANGASASCTINVDIVDPNTTANVADVSGGQNDPNGSNNSSTAQLPPFGGPIPALGTAGVMLLVGLIAGIGLLLVRRFF